MNLSKGQDVTRIGPRLQITPDAAQQIAKLERYIARDPKGPKAAHYKARLAALKKASETKAEG